MIGQRLSDRYEILAELGRGGMGVVYRARDPWLERDVAVKVISLNRITRESEERFRREAQLVAKMDHPAIVPIFDLGAHQESLFFVMPVVEGDTLQSHIRGRSLALGDTLEIVAQVAEALDYSHTRGVVHRDVKPENVMVAWENGGWRARVMDFGLALVGAASRLTRTGKLPGTLIYLSPEQILSTELDGRSDLYSLGTILYECLTGEPPFSGSRYTLLYRIAHELAPELDAETFDETLRGIAARLLAKDATARPQRGNDLADELRAYRAALVSEDRHRTVLERARLEPATTDSTPLAGRVEETAQLARELDKSLASGCRLVMIGGDAGMGKTRLVRYVEELSRQRGSTLVLHGRFSSEDAFPYQGLGELIQDYFRDRETGRRSDAPLPDLADLGADLLALFPVLQEFPALRDAARAAAEPALSVAAAAADRTRIFEVLARTFTRLSGGGPLVLLLEQLHASSASIEALVYVVRRLASTPTLIVGTYRTSEIGRRHPLYRVLRGAGDDPRLSSIVLEPLDKDEHRELLTTLLGGSRMSDDLVEKLYRASEGNPYFIEEWVRWLLETGEIWHGSDGVWRLSTDAAVARDAIPETIQQTFEARLEQLPEEELRVLRAASVLGRSFDFADLADLFDPEIDEQVENLVREGFLEEDRRSREDRLIFASRLVRKTLYNGLPRRRRRVLHRRHAERLEKRFAGRLHRIYARLVHHFGEGDVGDKTQTYALALAREALDGFGWEAAIRAAKTALEFVDEETLGGSQAELRRLLAAALRSEGQLETALKEAARAARGATRFGHAGEAAEAALLAAEIAWQARKVDETRRWIAKGIELARDTQVPPILRRLLTLGATLANLSGEYNQAQAFRREAESLADPEPVATEEPIPRGGTLVTTLPHALIATDMATSTTAEEVEVLANIYETLLASGREGLLFPTLCHEWEGAARGRVFRFSLRPEVCFSDGHRLDATAVVRSFERSVRLGGKNLAPAFRALVGVGPFLAGDREHLEGLATEGEHVVELRLDHPLPIFPALLTDPRTAIAREHEGRLLGTGPFRWPEGAAGGDIPVVLERNPHYRHSARVPLERLELRIIPQSSDTATALRAGEIDVGRDLNPEDLEEILREPRFRSGLVEATRQNVHFVLFNASGPVARRAEIRRALISSVRVQDLVWRTLGRFAHPASGLIPPGLLGHDPGRRRPALSRDEARALIAASGLAKPVRLRGAVDPQLLERYAPLSRALFEEWSALGVEIEALPMPRSALRGLTADHAELDFRFGGWSLDYEDPDNLTFEMLHSRFGRLAGYLASNEADAMLERARQEVRAANRQQLYRLVETTLAAQEILLPLFHDVQYRIAAPEVRGLRLLSSPPFVNYAEIGKAAAPAPRPSRRSLRTSGTIHVPLASEIPSLAPEFAVLVDASEVIPNVFETLVHIDEGAHIVPWLASEFRTEEGGRHYRFRLRQNVRFHDGRRLTARDVRYSFERLLKVGRNSAEAPLLPIRGARDVAAGTAGELAGFEVVTAREFVIELERPLSYFPAMLTSPVAAIIPEPADVFSGDWRHGTAGTGPFRAVRLEAEERVELEANPHYWRAGLPRCDRLIFELGQTPAEVVADFRAGRLGLAANLRPEDIESLRRDAELAAGYREAPGFSTYFLALNRHAGVLAADEKRHALVRLLDVAAARATLGRVAIEARGLIPPGLLGQKGPVRTPRPADVDPSTALPAGTHLRCSLHPIYRDTYQSFWQSLTATLRDAGVELEVHYTDRGRLFRVEDEADLVATRWLADYPDSGSFVQILHSAEGIEGRICGQPQIDQLIERGRSETDPGLRHALYHEIENLTREEAVIVPLFHEQTYRFARPEISGLRLGLRAPEVAYEELSLLP